VEPVGIGLPSFSIRSNSLHPRSTSFCSHHARKAPVQGTRSSPVQFPPAHQLNHFLQNPFRTRKTMKSAQGVLSYAEEAFLNLTKSGKKFSRKWWSRWEFTSAFQASALWANLRFVQKCPPGIFVNPRELAPLARGFCISNSTTKIKNPLTEVSGFFIWWR
jgi:hypothetical protein